MPPSWHRKIKESMGSVAVKINFLTHSMAQGKKQEPLTRDGIPGPSSNIQEAVIQGFTARGKEVVSPFTFYKSMLCDSLNDIAIISVSWTWIITQSHRLEWKPCVCFCTQIYDLRVTIDDGYLNSETTYGQMEMIHKQLQKHFIESTLPQWAVAASPYIPER